MKNIVEAYIKKNNTNKTDFANKANISRMHLNRILKGDNVSLNTLQKIADILGIGVADLIEEKKEKANIEYYEHFLSAGFGVAFGDEKPNAIISIDKSFLKNYNINSIIALPVKGDSMFPKIKSNSIVLIDRSNNFLENGFLEGIYAFCFEDSTYIKYLQKKGKQIYAVSENPVYSDMVFDENSILNDKIHFRVIGRVVLKFLEKI